MRKEAVQAEFRKQVDTFVEKGVDFLLCEYFEHIEEAEWAIQVCKETSLPVACSLCIGPEGDLHGVSTKECGARMVKAGADIVGINCHYDPFVTLDAVQLVIDGVKEAGLQAHYIAQPLAYHTPDAGKQGFIDLPEFPFALEPRICASRSGLVTTEPSDLVLAPYLVSSIWKDGRQLRKAYRKRQG